MQTHKTRLKRPPLTTQEARSLAENTLSRLKECERRIQVLTEMLDIAYPLLPEATQIQLQAMALSGAPKSNDWRWNQENPRIFQAPQSPIPYLENRAATNYQDLFIQYRSL